MVILEKKSNTQHFSKCLCMHICGYFNKKCLISREFKNNPVVMCAGVHSLMHNVQSIYVVIFHSLSLSQPLYAGVVSLCEDAEFTITFHRKDTLAAAKGKQYLVYSTV